VQIAAGRSIGHFGLSAPTDRGSGVDDVGGVDDVLSSIASGGGGGGGGDRGGGGGGGRGFHSYTSQLNLSRFCHSNPSNTQHVL